VRLRIATRSIPFDDALSLMLVSAPPKDNSWQVEEDDKVITYTGASGLFALPQGDLQRLSLSGTPEGFFLKGNPLRGKVKWQVRLLNVQWALAHKEV
jgi:hypothetical protein